MLDGFNWDYKRAMELFLWRAGKGEMTATMQSFDWGAWFDKFWQFAVTNFTIPVIVLAIVGVLAHVGRRVAAYVKARNTKKPVPLLAGSPQLLLLLMPGVLQLFILRGALWKHQYWELPLAPFLAIAVTLCLLVPWDLLNKKVGKPLAAVAIVAVLAIIAVPCVQGANYYYGIRWQHPDRIALWKELNRLVPADKSLLTFDPVLDNLLVTQSEAKGEVIRAEPAWYIDRPIMQVPSKPEVQATYAGLANANARAVQVMNNLVGNLPPNARDFMLEAARGKAEDTLRLEVHKLALQNIPKIIAELESKRSEAPVYLLPRWLNVGSQQFSIILAMYIQELNAELSKRYALVYYAPEREFQPDEKGDFFRAGMVPYYVYDLTKGPGESTVRPE
jgi:hypothetical protein